MVETNEGVRRRVRPTAPSAETPAFDAAKAATTPATPVAPRGALPRARVAGTPAMLPRATQSPTEPVADTSWMKSGSAAEEEAERVRREREERREQQAETPLTPFRFVLAWNKRDDHDFETGQGEEADAIILDSEPGPRFYEHAVRDPNTGRWGQFEACPHEWEECPLCPPLGERAPYFVMMLTVLDLRQVRHRESGELIAVATRKLLPVKIDQQAYFDDLYREHGTLRGIRNIHRRSHDQRSSTIGDSISFDSILDDETLINWVKEVGLWEARHSEAGRLIYGEGEIIQPYNYGLIFPRPSAANLRRKYGGQAPVGSQEFRTQQGFGNSDPGRFNSGGRTPRGGNGAGRRARLDDTDDIPF